MAAARKKVTTGKAAANPSREEQASLFDDAAPTKAPLPGLTDQQRRAIETRDVSIALSAGAGCGKTFVLTERFLSHLAPPGISEDQEPAELAELVAFTYTERAAREMRDRIRRKCRERLDAASESDAPYWLSILRQLDTARVSTIHSFCGSFLRSHAVEAGLDPQFRVLNEAQSQTRLWELLDDALRKRLEARDPAIMDLAGAYGLAPLRERVLKLLRYRDHGAFESFAGTTTAELVAHWQTLAAARRKRAVAEFVQSPPCLAAKLYFDTHTFEHDKIGLRAETLQRLLGELAETEQPAEVLAAIKEAAKLTGLSKKMFDSIGVEYEDYKACVQFLREAIDGVKHIELNIDSARAAAEHGLAMLQIAREVAAAYRQSKRSDHALDFNDLLLETRRVLVAPANADMRRGISRQIRLLLVDESQDTDPVQAELIDALCDGEPNAGKLFVVGDFKQSIYRFLGAEPRIFRDRRQTMPERGRLPLSRNFRSQPAILDFVNLLFAPAFGVDYEPLVSHREQFTPPPAIEFLWATEPDPTTGSAVDASGENESMPTKANTRFERGAADRLRRVEADWIARRVSGMIRSGFPLIPTDAKNNHGDNAASSLRTVRPGDVAILFRALSNVEFYEEALRRYDIPYYVVGGRAFYAQQEIFDLSNLLRTLVSPSDDVSLAGALRSPLFNLADEALFWLAQHPEGLRGGLFAEKYPSGMEADQQRRANRAAKIIAELRASKDRLSVASLVERAIALTGYDAALLSEFLGERKLANLHKLVSLARSFDSAGMMSLADFVVQLNEFVADQPKEALAATESEAGDVVRLMTIHQSKGLEFPVVVVADCETQLRPDNESARFDPQWGPLVGLPTHDDEGEATTALRMYRAESRSEEEQEAIRLFYVATTRAADYLVISGGTKDSGEPQGFWTKYLAQHFDRLSGKYLGVAPDGIAPPRIAVSTVPPDAYAEPAPHARGPNLERIADEVEHRARTSTSLANERPIASDPVLADNTARRFYSFSSLTGLLAEENPIPASSDPANESEPARTPLVTVDADDLHNRGQALDLGTLVHEIIADMRWDDTDDIPALAARRMAKQLRADESLERHAVQLIERLLTMPIMNEVGSARERFAETEFLLAWPPDAKPTDNSPILHGFIDLLFRDTAGDWHIVDYKTNRITTDQVPATAAIYELQLALYALAAEQILGVPPNSLRLCFLVPGVEHRVAWHESAQAHAMERLSAAVHSAREKSNGD